MNPSVLPLGMLKRKTHCFLQSLLQSSTRARKGKTRGTIEINALLQKATKEFTKEQDRCFLSLLFMALTLYCLMVCVYVALSLALWLTLCLMLLHSGSKVLSHKACADSRKPSSINRWASSDEYLWEVMCFQVSWCVRLFIYFTLDAWKAGRWWIFCLPSTLSCSVNETFQWIMVRWMMF